jgi:hypothetical protein
MTSDTGLQVQALPGASQVYELIGEEIEQMTSRHYVGIYCLNSALIISNLRIDWLIAV